MERFLGGFAPQIVSIMRILVGLNFATHGAQKLFGAFGGSPPEAPAFVIYVGGVIELVGGGLVALGLFTSYAAFACSGMMAAAYFMAHMPQGFFPILNRGELAIAYCWIFLYLAAAGGGPISLDAVLGSGNRGRATGG